MIRSLLQYHYLGLLLITLLANISLYSMSYVPRFRGAMPRTMARTALPRCMPQRRMHTEQNIYAAPFAQSYAGLTDTIEDLKKENDSLKRAIGREIIEAYGTGRQVNHKFIDDLNIWRSVYQNIIAEMNTFRTYLNNSAKQRAINDFLHDVIYYKIRDRATRGQ